MPRHWREPVADAMARVGGQSGVSGGPGVLISPEEVLTCTATIEAADGEVIGERPVTVSFPLVRSGEQYTATAQRIGRGRDLAVLRLAEPAPEGVSPAPLYRPALLTGRRVRVFGVPPGRRDGAWLGGELREDADGALLLVPETEGQRVMAGYCGAPVWDDDVGAVVAIVAAEGSGASAEVVPIDQAFAVDPFALPCPYVGLQPFGEADAGRFFGRDADVDRVATALTSRPVVAIAGRSGSGKSSLVHAGLIPRLREGGTAVAVFRAGRAVGAGAVPAAGSFAALATALADVLVPDGTAVARYREARLIEQAMTTGDGVGEIAERLARRNTVIIADQFEEIGAVSGVSGDGAALLAVLVELVRSASRPADGRSPVRAVITTRWETLDDLTSGQHQPFGRLSGHDVQSGGDRARLADDCALVALAPMSREQLRAAVLGPVTRPPGLAFEPGVVEQIIDDSLGEPGQLPLVGALLTELWEQRTGGTIRMSDYERSGGVQQALTRRAERAIGALADTVDARRLLTRLVRPTSDGGEVRRPAPMADLTTAQQNAAEHLAQARVLVIGPDAAGRQTVELAHQALIDLWPRLRGWLAADRRFRTWHDRIDRQRVDWEEAGRDPQLLLSGTALLRAEEWLADRDGEISAPNLTFVRAAQARRRKEMWLRRSVRIGIAAAAVAALTLGSLFIVQREVAGQREAAAASRAMAAEASEIAPTDPVEAGQLALAAYRTDANAETEQALLSAYLSRRETAAATSDTDNWRLTPAGTHVVRVVDDGTRLETAAVYDLARTRASVPRSGSVFQDPGTMCLCMYGSLLADRLADGTVEVRHMPDLELVGTVDGPPASTPGVDVRLQDGLVLILSGHRAEWWDPRSAAKVDELNLVELGVVDPRDADRIVPHPDPELVGVLAASGALRIVDRTTGDTVDRIELGADVIAAGIYGDGDYIGAVRRGSVPELWRADGSEPAVGPLPSLAPRCSAGREGAFRCRPTHYGFVWELLVGQEQLLVGDSSRLSWYDPVAGGPVRVLDLDADGTGRQPIAASADGETLLYREPDGAFGVAVLDPEVWVGAVCAEADPDTLAEASC